MWENSTLKVYESPEIVLTYPITYKIAVEMLETGPEDDVSRRPAAGVRARITARWGWVVTMATFITQFLGTGSLYAFGIINVAIQEDFRVGLTTAGWIPTIATGITLMGSLVTEGVVKRTSNRLVGFAGTALCFCACVVTSCMPSVTPMYVTFGLVYGVGLSFLTFAAIINIVDWFPDKNRSAAIAIGIAGSSIGMLTMNPVMFRLVAAVGWRNTLRIVGSVLLGVCSIACSTFSKPGDPHREDQGVENSVKEPTLKYNNQYYTEIRIEDNVAAEPMNKHAEANTKFDTEIHHGVKISLTDEPLNYNGYDKIRTDEPMTNYEDGNAELDTEKHHNVKNGIKGPTLNHNDNNKIRSEDGGDAVPMTKHEEADTKFDTGNYHVKNGIKESILNDYNKIRSEDAIAAEPIMTRHEEANTEHDTRIHLELLKFPEFWFLMFAILICEMSVSVVLFYWVSLVLSLGFPESTAALAMTIIGAMDATGKFLLAGLADRLPFPKLFLFHTACLSGVAVMLGMMRVESVVVVYLVSAATGLFVLSHLNALPYIVPPQVFPRRGATPITTSTLAVGIGLLLGTVYGTSVDVTGSFNSTLYGCVVAYLVSIILFSLVPLYQAWFAPDRYLLWKDVPSARCI